MKRVREQIRIDGVHILGSVKDTFMYLKVLPLRIAGIEMYPSLEIRYLHSYNK